MQHLCLGCSQTRPITSNLSIARNAKSTLVGVGYGRPWIDQWRPDPKRGLLGLEEVEEGGGGFWPITRKLSSLHLLNCAHDFCNSEGAPRVHAVPH